MAAETLSFPANPYEIDILVARVPEVATSAILILSLAHASLLPHTHTRDLIANFIALIARRLPAYFNQSRVNKAIQLCTRGSWPPLLRPLFFDATTVNFPLIRAGDREGDMSEHRERWTIRRAVD